jgi:hypothetical protein
MVFTQFPFTDRSGARRRPALVGSHENNRRFDLGRATGAAISASALIAIS